jgi:DNA ligase (NAD+)
MKFEGKSIDHLIKNPKEEGFKLKITELVNILKHADNQYYNTGETFLGDDVYDTLKEILTSRSPKNKYLESIGAPITKDKTKLPFPMASLDKIKPDMDKYFASWLATHTGPYLLTDKLDGISGLLYNNGETIKLYSRGDGLFGQDITHLLAYLNIGIDYNIIPKNVAIRGEIIISKKHFASLNKNKEYKNARNTCAGVVNSKTVPINIAKVTDFVAYSVIKPELSYEDQIKYLIKLNIKTVFHKKVTKLSIKGLSDTFTDRRGNSEYEVDGVVVMDSSKVYKLHPDILNNPTYGFAFKMPLSDQTAQVVVKSIEWECSKHGLIKPRVKIEPVTLVGVTITFVTAFNAKFVVDNKLGPGAIIEIVRSGDVIPDIKSVVKPAAKASLPTHMKYVWNKSGVDILADSSDKTCQNIINIKQINSFFTTIGVKHLSQGIVTKLVDAGYNTLFKIIGANKSDLYNIDGLGKTSIDKIYKNMMTALNSMTLEKLMAASIVFGRGLGQRKCKLIVKRYPNILSINITKEMLNDIGGFDDISSNQFLDALPAFKVFYKSLEKLVDLSYMNTVKKAKSNLFADRKIVFTGFRNKELEDFIENNGGQLVSSVSKNTSLIVYSDISSAKYVKGVELNIPIIELSQFKKKYNLM